MGLIKRISSIRAETLVSGFFALALFVVGCLIVWIAFLEIQAHAIDEAEGEAKILLHYNAALHDYLSQELRPEIWEMAKEIHGKDYFNPVWMSTTFASGKINERFLAYGDVPAGIYKEAAVNARDPRSEADALEREFLELVNRDPTIQSVTRHEIIDHNPYFVVMVKGETMVEACVTCHTDPAVAPAGLVARYGSERSFNREIGDVVSVISVRVPMAAEYGSMWKLVGRLGALLFLSLLGLFMIFRALQKKLVFAPIEQLREKAVQIARDDRALGQQVPLPYGRELMELTGAFNEMSLILRTNEDRLERTIENRTAELNQSQYILNSILGTIPHFVGVFDHQTGKFLYVNREFKRFLGETVETILNKSIKDYSPLVHADDQEIFMKFLLDASAAKDDEVVTAQFRVKRASVEDSWLEFRAVVFQRQADGQPHQILFTSQDITLQKEAEAKLTFLGLHDTLTGLSNRAQFNYFMEGLQNNKDQFPVTVLMADIDNLKTVNDTHGHEAGDELLCQVAGALKSSLRSSDIVARFGGDEFAALLVNANQNAASRIQERIEKRLVDTLAQEKFRQANLSIGMITVDQPEDLKDALRQADELMYTKKAFRKARSQGK